MLHDNIMTVDMEQLQPISRTYQYRKVSILLVLTLTAVKRPLGIPKEPLFTVISEANDIFVIVSCYLTKIFHECYCCIRCE
jgi:hypothetical protein